MNKRKLKAIISMFFLSCFVSGCAPVSERLARVFSDSLTVDEQKLKETLKVDERKFGPNSSEVRFDCVQLGRFFYRENEWVRAEPWWMRSLSIDRQNPKVDWKNLHEDLKYAGDCFFRQEHYEKAYPLLSECSVLSRAKAGVDSEEYDQALFALASNQHSWGKYTQADDLYKQLLEIRHKTYSANSNEVLEVLEEIAHNLAEYSKFDEAQYYYGQAFAIAKKTARSEENEKCINIICEIADTYALAKRWKLSRKNYENALRLSKLHFGERSDQTIDTLHRVSASRAVSHDFKGAAQAIEESIALRSAIEQMPTAKTPDNYDRMEALKFARCKDHLILARLYALDGDEKATSKQYDAAMQILDNMPTKFDTTVSSELLSFANTLESIKKRPAALNVVEKLSARMRSGADILKSPEQERVAAELLSYDYFYESRQLFQVCADLRQRRNGANSSEYLADLIDLVRCEIGLKDFKKAKQLAERTLDISLKNAGLTEYVPDVLTVLFQANLGLKKPELARGQSDEIIKIVSKESERAGQKDIDAVADSLIMLASLYKDYGYREDAQKLFEKSVAIRRSEGKQKELADALTVMADHLADSTKTEDLSRAAVLYDEAAATTLKSISRTSHVSSDSKDPIVDEGSISFSTEAIREKKAMVFEKQKKLEEARMLWEQCLHDIEREAGNNTDEWFIVNRHLASICFELKDYEHARKFYEQTIALNQKGIRPEGVKFEDVLNEYKLLARDYNPLK